MRLFITSNWHFQKPTTCDSSIYAIPTSAVSALFGLSILSLQRPEELTSRTCVMANLTRVGLVAAILVAVLSQLPITRSIWTMLKLGLAIGKVLQPISDFPSYQCRRIHDPLLQACEDMWLSEATRRLFLACSDSDNRANWHPKYAVA